MEPKRNHPSRSNPDEDSAKDALEYYNPDDKKDDYEVNEPFNTNTTTAIRTTTIGDEALCSRPGAFRVAGVTRNANHGDHDNDDYDSMMDPGDDPPPPHTSRSPRGMWTDEDSVFVIPNASLVHDEPEQHDGDDCESGRRRGNKDIIDRSRRHQHHPQTVASDPELIFHASPLHLDIGVMQEQPSNGRSSSTLADVASSSRMVAGDACGLSSCNTESTINSSSRRKDSSQPSQQRRWYLLLFLVLMIGLVLVAVAAAGVTFALVAGKSNSNNDKKPPRQRPPPQGASGFVNINDGGVDSGFDGAGGQGGGGGNNNRDGSNGGGREGGGGGGGGNNRRYLKARNKVAS